ESQNEQVHSASRFQHQEPIMNRPCSVSFKIARTSFVFRQSQSWLKMLVSHKEYGSIEKDRISRGGGIVVTLFLHGGGQVKESRKKVGQVTFSKSRLRSKSTQCRGDSMSTP